MTAEMAAPAWTLEQITAEQYDLWPEEQCAGIRLQDVPLQDVPLQGVRLRGVPLTNRRPDVVVYRADTINVDVTPTRPERVLLVVEAVSPGSEAADRIVKTGQPFPVEIDLGRV